MDINEVQKIISDYGIAIRTIPKETKSVFEKNHINDPDIFPNGDLIYLEEYKRQMCVVKRVPKHSGEFLFVYGITNTIASVDFTNGMYFKTIEEGLQYAVENLQPIVN